MTGRIQISYASRSGSANPSLPYRYLDGHPPRSRNRVTAYDVSGGSFVSLHGGPGRNCGMAMLQMYADTNELLETTM